MFTTLNNEIASRIIKYAVEKKYRFCAYGLYNHYGLTFDEPTYDRLFKYVIEFLGDDCCYSILVDDSIDICVRAFMLSKLNLYTNNKYKL